MQTEKNLSSNTGFTLLELIIAGFLFSVIVALVAGFSVYYFKNYSFSFEEQQQVGQVGQAVTQIVREIRRARNGDNGSWPLIQTDDTTFIFYADVTSDGRADRIRYFMNGTTLQRGVIQPTAVPVTYPSVNETITTLATNISTSSALFKYYNGDYPADQINNPLAANQRILNTRYVTVTLKMDVSQNFAADAYTMTGGADIRSMKTNL
jgi:type II secretory pathway pseudopilin PulG